MNFKKGDKVLVTSIGKYTKYICKPVIDYINIVKSDYVILLNNLDKIPLNTLQTTGPFAIKIQKL